MIFNWVQVQLVKLDIHHIHQTDGIIQVLVNFKLLIHYLKKTLLTLPKKQAKTMILHQQMQAHIIQNHGKQISFQMVLRANMEDFSYHIMKID